MPFIRSFSLRKSAAVLALTGLLLAPGTAFATPDTLKRGFGNFIQGPIDMAMSPITAGFVLYKNLTNIEDTLAVQIFYAAPGYIWLTSLFTFASVLRTVSGVLEIPPGLVLLFSDADMDPIFDPSDRGEALLDYPTLVFDFKVGVDYTAAPF